MPNLSYEGKRAKIRNVVLMLRSLGAGTGTRQVLVVGAGDGLEAQVIAEELSVRTVAIDSTPRYAVGRREKIEFRAMDARAMEFGDGEFDLVYSYHVLEHIVNDKAALAEMARVLRTGGIFLVGTPNKTRMLSYLTTAPTWNEAIKWNLADWSQRLRGRFANEYGAHAGYTSAELISRCKSAFGEAKSLTDEYYRLNYPRYHTAIRLLSSTGLWRLMYPGIYVGGRKRRER